jgi:hypothetical protein
MEWKGVISYFGFRELNFHKINSLFSWSIAMCSKVEPKFFKSEFTSYYHLFRITTYNIYHLSLPKFVGEQYKLQQILASYPLILKVHNHSPQEINEML